MRRFRMLMEEKHLFLRVPFAPIEAVTVAKNVGIMASIMNA